MKRNFWELLAATVLSHEPVSDLPSFCLGKSCKKVIGRLEEAFCGLIQAGLATLGWGHMENHKSQKGKAEALLLKAGIAPRKSMTVA